MRGNMTTMTMVPLMDMDMMPIVMTMGLERRMRDRMEVPIVMRMRPCPIRWDGDLTMIMAMMIPMIIATEEMTAMTMSMICIGVSTEGTATGILTAMIGMKGIPMR